MSNKLLRRSIEALVHELENDAPDMREELPEGEVLLYVSERLIEILDACA